MPDDPNPYRPPEPIDGIEAELGVWQRMRLAIANWGSDSSDVGKILDEASSVSDVMSGKMFYEYGVVFCVMRGWPDRIFAAIPIAVDDQHHRSRCVAESARVLRELVGRIDGLGDRLGTRFLVISLIQSYATIGNELHRATLPAETWRMPHADDQGLNTESSSPRDTLDLAANDESDDRADQDADRDGN